MTQELLYDKRDEIGWIIFNRPQARNALTFAMYEGLAEICARVGTTREVKALVVTHGGKGSQIHAGGRIIDIPTAKAESLTDPTGCGDAYRGGLLYGLLNKLDWETTGRVASLMGAYCIERPGTQNHRFTMDQFRSRYKKAFRVALA